MNQIDIESTQGPVNVEAAGAVSISAGAGANLTAAGVVAVSGASANLTGATGATVAATTGTASLGSLAGTVVVTATTGIFLATPGGDVRVTPGAAGALTVNARGPNAGDGGQIKLRELANVKSVGLRAPDVLAADLVLTLPSADGKAGAVMKTNGAGGISFDSPCRGMWSVDTGPTASGTTYYLALGNKQTAYTAQPAGALQVNVRSPHRGRWYPRRRTGAPSFR